MRRKSLYFILIGILICLILLLLIKEGNIDNNIETISSQDNDGDHQEEDVDSSVIENVKEFFVDATQSTTNFLFQKETQIVAVGDSLTEGIGDRSGNGGYIGFLDETINQDEQLVEFTNYGHRGHRTDQLLKRLEDPEISKTIERADIVLITIGANDIMQVVKENFTQLTIELFTEERIHFETRLNDILKKVTTINPSTDIYLLGIYNPFKQYFEDIKELDEIVDEWNRTGEMVTNNYEQTTFIPMKDIFDHSEDHLFAKDNFHPNKLGYEQMAERVLDYLTEEEGRLP